VSTTAKPDASIVVGGTYELVTSSGELRFVRPLAIDGDRVWTDHGFFCTATFLDRWKLVGVGDWTIGATA
jgi:hypothetical protein